MCDAAKQAAAHLGRLGIRHALAGGLAVGAHGYVRATRDVYFLVGEEAFETHGQLVTFKSGVPIEVNGIQIDYLSEVSLGIPLRDVFQRAPSSGGLAVVPIEVLIHMKLVAGRRRDLSDIVELLKAGADEHKTRQYIQQNAADLGTLFDELASEANA